jgi:hypothetical protein
MSLPLGEGDRVAIRDRPWRIQSVQELAPGQHLLKLLPAGGDGGRPLAVVTPPERVTPLPPEELRFDPAELEGVLPRDAARPAFDKQRAAQLIDLATNIHLGGGTTMPATRTHLAATSSTTSPPKSRSRAATSVPCGTPASSGCGPTLRGDILRHLAGSIGDKEFPR